ARWPLTKKQIVFEEVRAISPVVFVRMRPDGTPNMMDLVPVTPAGSETASANEKPMDMIVRVDRASITNGSAEYHDLTTTPETVAAVDSINATALSYRSNPEDTTQFHFSFAQRGTNGRAKAKGWVIPMATVVQARIDADSLSIVPADPYLGQFAHLDIKSGKIAAHGDMHVVVKPDGTDPVVDYNGDLVSDDLHLYDNLKKQDFFG